MKLKRVKVPIYDYSVIVAEVEKKGDAVAMSKVLSELKVPNEHKADVLDMIERESFNGGDTFRNMKMKKLLVIIYPCKNESARRNVLAHEMRHVVDRIMEWSNITDMEASAYLQGWLGEKIY
ncbi:MAG: hypothetical protein NC209_03945 [Alistipes sp.]|nr:hypothetical protein [Lachnospiraceae bacterium]MCM1250283.1 hypothetical protein [Alistipes sp.]